MGNSKPLGILDIRGIPGGTISVPIDYDNLTLTLETLFRSELAEYNVEDRPIEFNSLFISNQKRVIELFYDSPHPSIQVHIDDSKNYQFYAYL